MQFCGGGGRGSWASGGVCCEACCEAGSVVCEWEVIFLCCVSLKSVQMND